MSLVVDASGRVVRRVERDDESAGDPESVHYRFGGQEMGSTSNNGIPDAQLGSYTAGVARASAGGGDDALAFRGGSATGEAWAGAANGWTATTPAGALSGSSVAGAGASGSTYTAQGGETLSQVAAGMWGDAGLWYRLAQANGMGGDTTLSAGQSLVIPTGVQRNTYNAHTHAPYDPGEAVGDLSPTAPQPGQGGKCGAFGTILLVVVATAVAAIVTAGAAAALTTELTLKAALASLTAQGGLAGAVSGAVAAGGSATLGTVGTLAVAGAVGGAVGSVASQGFGVATGLQDRFDWKGVGMAAISGGISGGLGAIGTGHGALGKGLLGKAMGNAFLRGATSSALTQGIGRATGLQDKFSWSGVAAAGVGSQVGAWTGVPGDALGLVSGGASAIANAATRSALDGSSFGDNIMAAIPDVIGQAIGNAVVGGVSGQASRAIAEAEANPSQGGGFLGGAMDFVGGVFEFAANLVAAPLNMLDVLSAGIHESIAGDVAARQAAKVQYRQNEIIVTAQRQADIDWRLGVYDALSARNFASAAGREDARSVIARTSLHVADRMAMRDAVQARMAAERARSNLTWEQVRGSVQGQGEIIGEVYAFAAGTAVRGLYETGMGILHTADHVSASLGWQGHDALVEATAANVQGVRAVGARVRTLGSREGWVALASDTVGGVRAAYAADQARMAAAGANGASAFRIGWENATMGTAAAGVASAPFGGGLLRTGGRATVAPSATRVAYDEPIGPIRPSAAPEAKVHKNSLAYVGETHVYKIIGPDGSVYKIGESAQGLRMRDGASIRAEQQVRALRKSTGENFESAIVASFSDKASARVYETRLIQRYRSMYGANTLPGNLTNR